MTTGERKGDTYMEILRPLPSKHWPSGAILSRRDGCTYIKQGGTKYIGIDKFGVIQHTNDNSLHHDDIFHESVWSFNYLPPEFFD